MVDESGHCCFCFEHVEWAERVELAVSPRPDHDVGVQGLICHRACLVSVVDRRVPLHPDLTDDRS